MSEEQYAQLQAQKQQEEKDQRPGSYIMVGGKPVPDPLEARIAEEARKSGGINVIIPGSSSGEHLLYAQREAERLGGSVVVQTEKDFTSVKVEERGSSGQIFLDPKVTTAEDVLMYRAQYPEAKIYLTPAAEAFPVRQPVQTPALPETPEGFRWVPVSREGDTTTYSLRPEGEQWASGVDIEGLTEQQKAMFAGLPKSGKLFYTEDKGWYAETTASASESAPKNIFGLPKLDDPRVMGVGSLPSAEGSVSGMPQVTVYSGEVVSGEEWLKSAGQWAPSQTATRSTMVPLEVEGATGTELIYGWAQGQSGVMRDVGMFAAGAWGSGVESMWRPDVPNVFSATAEAIEAWRRPDMAGDMPHLTFLQKNPSYAAGGIMFEVAMLAGPEVAKGLGSAERIYAGIKYAPEVMKVNPLEGLKSVRYGKDYVGGIKAYSGMVKVQKWAELPRETTFTTKASVGVDPVGYVRNMRTYDLRVRGDLEPRGTSWRSKDTLWDVSSSLEQTREGTRAKAVTALPGSTLRTEAEIVPGMESYLFEYDRAFPRSRTFEYTQSAIIETTLGRAETGTAPRYIETPAKAIRQVPAKGEAEAVSRAINPSSSGMVSEMVSAGRAGADTATANRVRYVYTLAEPEWAEPLRFGALGSMVGAEGARVWAEPRQLGHAAHISTPTWAWREGGASPSLFTPTPKLLAVPELGISAQQPTLQADMAGQAQKVTPLESQLSRSAALAVDVASGLDLSDTTVLQPQSLRTSQLGRVSQVSRAMPKRPRLTKLAFPNTGSTRFSTGTGRVRYVESINPFPLDIVPKWLRRLGL